MPCHHIKALIHTSAALQRLHDKVPTDYFTLSWLMSRLRRRSNGIVMLLLALVAIAPGVSIVAGLLLMIPAFQMIAGKPAPIFPPSHCPTSPTVTALCCSGTARCTDPEISRKDHPSAVACPARGNQASGRCNGPNTERDAGVQSDSPEQRRPCPGDHADLARLSRGGRTAAPDCSAVRADFTDSGVRNAQGGSSRREMAKRFMVVEDAARCQFC